VRWLPREFPHAQFRLGMTFLLSHLVMMVVVVRMPAGLATSHQVDLADPRFAQLYTADDFALDPTDPRFKV
jgi:NUC153 domain